MPLSEKMINTLRHLHVNKILKKFVKVSGIPKLKDLDATLVLCNRWWDYSQNLRKEEDFQLVDAAASSPKGHKIIFPKVPLE